MTTAPWHAVFGNLLRTTARILPHSEERRRFQRVKVNLLGRYMLADRREFPCQVVNMSPGGMAVFAPVLPQFGERVIAYIDHVGRLEGVCTRHFENGFASTIGATSRKRDKLAAQLTWLANRHLLELAGRPPPRTLCAAKSDDHADPAERHQYRLPADRRCRCRVLRSPPTSVRRWARWSRSEMCRAAWCDISTKASPSSSLRLQHPDFLEESVVGG